MVFAGAESERERAGKPAKHTVGLVDALSAADVEELKGWLL
jgi:hypothetical protein